MRKNYVSLGKLQLAQSLQVMDHPNIIKLFETFEDSCSLTRCASGQRVCKGPAVLLS